MKTNKLLATIVVLQGLILIGQWTGGVSIPSAQAQVPDPANRQMQIPALFGHQAFAVNFAYENFPFSRDRLGLQALLEADEWSDAISEAARMHGWTHLLIHKDYRYPAPIPLEESAS